MTDAEIISHYGGPASFARLLGLDAPGAVQRVSNWISRGIPAEVKLANPSLFGITIGALPTVKTRATDSAGIAQLQGQEGTHD